MFKFKGMRIISFPLLYVRSNSIPYYVTNIKFGISQRLHYLLFVKTQILFLFLIDSIEVNKWDTSLYLKPFK